jgi:hypothetical protein
MREIAVSDEMTSDRGKWREKTCRADPSELGKGQEEEGNCQMFSVNIIYVESQLE